MRKGEPVHAQYGRKLEMLVLSRRKDKSIMIGKDVRVVIVDVRGNKVRQSIAARFETSPNPCQESGEKIIESTINPFISVF